MKITVYSLTTYDDGHMDTQFFDSEEAMNAEIKRIIQDHCGDEFDEILEAAGDDVQEIYSMAQNDYSFEIDMHWSSHTLDLPAPEPVNAGLLAAAKSAISWLRVMGHDRTDSGALELSRALTRACKTAGAQPTAERPLQALDAPPASETSAALMRYADDLEQIVADLREAGLDGDALDTIDAISTALERMAEGALADDAERCASCGLPLPLEPSDDFGTCQCGGEGEE